MSALASVQTKLLQQQQCQRVFGLIDRNASFEAQRECKRLLGGGPSQPVDAPAEAGAQPGQKVELTQPRAAQAFPLAESLLAFCYMRTDDKVLALSTALRMKEQGWGSSDHQVAVPLASVFRHYRQLNAAAEVIERAYNHNNQNEALAKEAFEAFLIAQNYQRAQSFALELHRRFGPSPSTAPKIPASAPPKRPRGAARKPASNSRAKKATDQYFWWSMTCYLLCNYQDPELGKKLSLPLAEGMIRKHTSLGTLLGDEDSASESKAPYFTGAPAELEKFQVILTVLTKQEKWDLAYRLLETEAGRAHAGLPSGPLFEQGKPTDAPLFYEEDNKPSPKEQAQAQLEAGILGNIDLRKARWEAMRQLGKWSELSEELTWRFLHGDHDWSTLKSLITASIEQGPGAAASVLSLLEQHLPTPTPLFGSEESNPSTPTEAPEASAEPAASGASKKNKKKRTQANKKKNALVKERGIFLARIELARQWRASRLASQSAASSDSDEARLSQVNLRQLIQGYFEAFSTKPCAYEDLVPYLPDLDASDKDHLRDEFLAPFVEPERRGGLDDERGLCTYMNALKLRSALSSYPSTDADSATLQAAQTSFIADAEQYWSAYQLGLRAGKHLPPTEMQPADDLAYMSAEALVAAWTLANSGKEVKPELLLAAAQVLGKALVASPKGYKLRLLLVRISIVLGAFSLAQTHYDLLGVRFVQQDTMAHWLLERSGSYALLDAAIALSDQRVKGPVQRALDGFQETYAENLKVTPKFLAQCFDFGNYTRAEELLDFYSAVEYSLSRTLNHTEELMLQLTLGQDKTVLADTALRIVATPQSVVAKYDQRDRKLLPSYLSLTATPVVDSLRFGPQPNASYAHALATAVARATGSAEATTIETGDLTALTGAEQKLVQFLSATQPDLSALRSWVTELASQVEQSTTPVELLHLANVVVRAYRGAQMQGASMDEQDQPTLNQLADQIDAAAIRLGEQLGQAKEIKWLPDPSGPVVASSLAASRTATQQATTVLRSLACDA